MVLSIAAEEHVDQVGHVFDGHHAVAVHVSIGRQLITAQQLVNQVSSVADGNVAVAVDVARPRTAQCE